MPTGVKIIREKGSTTAHLQWSLEKKNGKVLFYEVRYYKVGSGFDQRVNSIFMNITITGLDPESDYRFVVRGLCDSFDNIAFCRNHCSLVVILFKLYLVSLNQSRIAAFFL